MVESARPESVFTCKSDQGSNPCLSAINVGSVFMFLLEKDILFLFLHSSWRLAHYIDGAYSRLCMDI